jgi:hypothetical protein
MGSGYADYNIELTGERVELPLIRASEETLRGLAEIVHDFDAVTVIQRQWPKRTRPVSAGTGYGSVTQGDFDFQWKDNYCYAQNAAVGGDYIVCRKDANICYTREANYHPDGGQIVCPKVPGTKFIMVLAPPNENVQASDFKAYYFDGTFGLQILPDVWHQPLIPIDTLGTYRNKQGSIHACVVYDSLEEEKSWMCFSLTELPWAE